MSQMSNTDAEATAGALSFGEFGSVITSLFRPSSKADSQWRSREKHQKLKIGIQA